MRQYRLLLAVVFVIFVLTISTTTRTAAASDPVKILFIGNSFSEDTSAYLYNIATSNGKNVVVAEAHIGGMGLADHVERIKADRAEYRYVRYDHTGRTTINKRTLGQLLRADDWDIVFMQQNSQNSGDHSTFQPYLNQLHDYVLRNVKNSTRVKVGLNGTWAYATTYHSFPSYAPNQLMMYDSITKAYKAELSLRNYDYYIPSGTAIQNARSNGNVISPYGKELTRDGIHLETTIGRYTAGLAAYKAIFGANDEKKDYFVQPQNTEEQVLLKRYLNEAANAAIKNPHSFTKIDYDNVKYVYYRQRISPIVEKVSDAQGNVYTNLTVLDLTAAKKDIQTFLTRANVQRLTDSYAELFKKIDTRIQQVQSEGALVADLRARYGTMFEITETTIDMYEDRTYRQYSDVLNQLNAHYKLTTDVKTAEKLLTMIEAVEAYMLSLDRTYQMFFDKVSSMHNIFGESFAVRATEVLALYPTVSAYYMLTKDVVSKVEDIEEAKKDYDAFQETIENGKAYAKDPLITNDVNKVWTIGFNDRLEEEISSDRVTVMNQFGERHEVIVNVEDNKLIVTPAKSYMEDAVYYIVIEKWLRGQERLLKEQQYITFVVQQD